MRCHVCGGAIEATTSDLPFKLAQNRIVIFKNLPVLQCDQCGEYLLEDSVMARVEEMIKDWTSPATVDTGLSMCRMACITEEVSNGQGGKEALHEGV